MSTSWSLDRFCVVLSCRSCLLEEEPREPLLLNYAGIAIYELWSLDGARALFQAALRLDPSLPHVRSNLDELGRRRRVVRVPMAGRGDRLCLRLPSAQSASLPVRSRQRA